MTIVDAALEQQWISELESGEWLPGSEQHLHQLQRWSIQLEEDLQRQHFDHTGLRSSSEWAEKAQAIDDWCASAPQTWKKRWADLAESQALSDALDDQLVLLVFGKFNAGKSAFCNFLAERFAANGQPVQYFVLRDGYIVNTNQPFSEGATETTSQLQGVRLGKRLVLLDTPGLHSETQINAVLTQRFTDSADGVLWLSSSTSPGQVQALDELARELHRAKALLPVLTRSDVYDEDEVDGELRKCLRNKTAANRAEQETDVTARAREKLAAMGIDPELLRAPVSVSVFMAREQKQTPQALADAGFARLCAGLLGIAESARLYKRRKRSEVLLHHLEENVLGMMDTELAPQCETLVDALNTGLGQLPSRMAHVVQRTWRSAMSALPSQLEAYAGTQDIKALCGDVAQDIATKYARELAEELPGFDLSMYAIAPVLKLPVDVGYERLSGNDLNVTSEAPQIGYQRLYSELETLIEHSVKSLASETEKHCSGALKDLLKQVKQREQWLEIQRQQLSEFTHQLRSS